VDMLGMGMALRRMKNIERYGDTGYLGSMVGNHLAFGSLR